MEMDGYRQQLADEARMSQSLRESLYETQLWYSPDLWMKMDGKPLAKGELETDFLECMKTAKAIEDGISERIGGQDPIQAIHARANVEVCLVSRGYRAKEASKQLICENDRRDVLPVCYFARTQVLEYREAVK